MMINYRIKIGIIISILLFFVIINIPAIIKKYYINNTYSSKDEYVRTKNLAGYFDENGEGLYNISFEACSEIDGPVRVYIQNGNIEDERYTFISDCTIDMTQEYEHYSVDVEVVMNNSDANMSYLSFYGVFDSGVKPMVRFIKVKKIKDSI